MRAILTTIVLVTLIGCHKKDCEKATTKFEQANNNLKQITKDNYLNPGSVSQAEIDRAQQKYNEALKHKEGVCNK